MAHDRSSVRRRAGAAGIARPRATCATGRGNPDPSGACPHPGWSSTGPDHPHATGDILGSDAHTCHDDATSRDSTDAASSEGDQLCAPRLHSSCGAALAAAWSLSPVCSGPRRHAAAACSLAGTPTSRRAPRRPRHPVASLPPIVAARHGPGGPSDGGARWSRTFAPRRPRAARSILERPARGVGWRVVGRDVQDSAGAPRPSPRAGASTARAPTADGRTWVVRRRAATPLDDRTSRTPSPAAALDTSVWNDQEREHEAVYAPRTCALVDPGARSVGGGVLHLGVALDPARAGQPCDYEWTGSAGPQPLPAQQPGRHRAHLPHPARHRRRPDQAAARRRHALGVLDAPPGQHVLRRRPRRGRRDRRHGVLRREGPRRPRPSARSSPTTGPAGRRSASAGSSPTPGAPWARDREWWEEFHVFSVEWTPDGVRLPRRRPRVLPREPGGVPGAGLPRAVDAGLGLRARRPRCRRPRRHGGGGLGAGLRGRRPPRHGRRRARPPT